MNRDTEIICTLGPATSSTEMITAMASRGMNVARLNRSHGSYDDHQALIDHIRTVNKKQKTRIQILLDLEGPRIRIGELARPVALTTGQMIEMAAPTCPGKNCFPFDYPGSTRDIKTGADVFVDDGQIHLVVKGRVGNRLRLQVVCGGILKSRKGVNIPQFRMKNAELSEKDEADIAFAMGNAVDFIAQSFVTCAADIQRVTQKVKTALPTCRVIAKIENQEGVQNAVSIVQHCDGVMIARGDMGVSLPLYRVPLIQKYLIRQCNRRQKLVIVATQMLESMVEHPRPTRAEVSDVANAILDGADYVMLSAESAVGKYPLECVEIMRQIIEYTERYENRKI